MVHAHSALPDPTQEPTPASASAPSWLGFGSDHDAVDVDDLAVCPIHLRFAPCRRCPDDQLVLSSAVEHITAARRFHAGEHPECRSAGCESVPAIVEGIFDPRNVNDNSPQETFYCYRCGVLLNDWGPFTPGRALYRVSADDLLAAFDPELRDWAQGTETFALITAAPPT